MKRFFFGVMVALCCSATSASAGSIYDGIWYDSSTGEISTFLTQGAGAVGDQTIVINMDLTQKWWDGLVAKFTGPNTATFSTILPTDTSSTGTITFNSATSMTLVIKSCTAISGVVCPQVPFTTTLTKIW